MLEQLRKHHYILMCVIAFVVIVAFTFLYDPNMTGRQGGPVARWNDRDIYREEMQELDGHRGLSAELLFPVKDHPLISGDPVDRFVKSLYLAERRYGSLSRSGDQVDLDFVFNLLIVREEAKRLGIEVRKEDVENLAQVILPFQTDGRFDAGKYRAFLNSGRGDPAIREKRLSTLLRDTLLFQKLNDLVGGTFPPSPAEVDADYAALYAEVTAATALVEKEKHTGDPVTDEDLQKFYDAEKDKPLPEPEPDAGIFETEEKDPSKSVDPVLLTAEKRAFHYVIVSLPERPKAPEPPKEEDFSSLPEEERKVKEEEAAKRKEEYRAAQEAYTQALKQSDDDRRAVTERAAKLSNSLNGLDRGDRKFEEIAKEHGFEPVTAGPVDRESVPEDLKKEALAVEAIFGADPSGNTFDPVRTANGYVFYEITQVEKPSVRPFEEVKEQIREKLTADRAKAALQAAAEAARSKLLEEIGAGKSFDEAAEALGLTVARIPAFSGMKPPSNLAEVPHFFQVRSEVQEMNPGDISQPVAVAEGLLLILLEKRELPNEPEMASRKQDLVRTRTSGGGAVQRNPYTGEYVPVLSPTLRAWFQAKRSAATEVTPGGRM